MLRSEAVASGVSVLLVRALASEVERAGVPRDQLLEAAGIEPARLASIDGWISFLEYDRLTRAALKLSGDPALGLRLGELSNRGAFDLLEHLGVHAATLRQSIESATGYARIMAARPEPALVEHGEVASLRYGFPPGDLPMLRIGAELSMAGALRLMQSCVGGDAQPIAACFAYRAPDYREEYERVFGSALRFEHDYTGLDFPRAWLERAMPHANPRLFAILEAQAQLALERLDQGVELGARVQAHLATQDPRSAPRMQDVAQHFGMSARSLRRRLSTEGLEYRALVEAARGSIARALLRQPRSTIQEVAHAMGFATPEAFHRAFRRWTGTTPGRFRERR